MTSRDEGSGVRVWRYWSVVLHRPGFSLDVGLDPKKPREPGRWFPEAEAAALVDVLDKARRIVWRTDALPHIALQEAIEDYDHARAASEGGTDA